MISHNNPSLPNPKEVMIYIIKYEYKFNLIKHYIKYIINNLMLLVTRQYKLLPRNFVDLLMKYLSSFV